MTNSRGTGFRLCLLVLVAIALHAQDLAEGKATLPLIHALRSAGEADRALIRTAIRQGGLAQLEPIVAAIESTGGIDYASRVAQRESELALQALTVLPDTPYRRGLAALAQFAVAHTT